MTQEYVRVLAGDLVTALKMARPRGTKKHKTVAVSLRLLPSKTELWIGEAKHGRFEYTIPATGTLASEPQADGAMIYRIASSYHPSDAIDLIVDEATVALVHGNARSTIPRVDGPKGKRIIRTDPPRDPRHKGKPEDLDPFLRPGVPQEKTWGFSAHMAPSAKKK